MQKSERLPKFTGGGRNAPKMCAKVSTASKNATKLSWWVPQLLLEHFCRNFGSTSLDAAGRKNAPKLQKKCVILAFSGREMLGKCSENAPSREMLQKCSKNAPKMLQKCAKNAPKMLPAGKKCGQNAPKMLGLGLGASPALAPTPQPQPAGPAQPQPQPPPPSSPSPGPAPAPQPSLRSPATPQSARTRA